MSLLDLKITEFDKKISELATRPNATSGMTDTEIKAWWDSSPEELRVKLNALIDALTSITAASQIGIDNPFGNTISEVIEYIISQGSGSIPGENSVSTIAIQDNAVTLDKVDFEVLTQSDLDAIAGVGRTTETIKGAYDLILSRLPAGSMIMWPAPTPPTGWFERDGSAVSRSVYSSLFSVVGTMFGVGNGTTTFNLPDDRGLVERGWDHGRGYDTGRTFGSYQADDNKAHTHTGTTNSAGAHSHSMDFYTGSGSNHPGSYPGSSLTETGATDTEPAHTHTFTTNSSGGSEVTMKNRAYLPIIKY